MNDFQKRWWQQAQSDFEILKRFRSQGGVSPCHVLHYLQMCTEKIAKAYAWRGNRPPGFTHMGFVEFLKLLANQRNAQKREKIAGIFGYKKFSEFQGRIHSTAPLSHAIERLATALANDGPNPEYPWPHAAPQYAPMAFEFADCNLENSTGRELLWIVQSAISQFSEYANI